MAHSLGPITSASATACSKDSPCFLLQPRNQAYRRHGHDHAPPALFRAAASLQQNHRRTTHTAANRAICSRSQRHSVRSFLACPQRRGCQIDQIAIGRTRGPRFRATKVLQRPRRSVPDLNHDAASQKPHRSANGGKDRWLALFCRANRAERCPLSGVDRPTYAQCEFFAF
jgi:hypothetical protein